MLARGADGLAVLVEQIGFGLRINHAAQHLARELAIHNFKLVGKRPIQPQAGFQAVGEISETARHQQKFDAVRLASADKFFRALRERKLVFIHFGKLVFRLPFEQGDAMAQRLFKVQFALHGAFGDFGDLVFEPRARGDFVNALNGD